VISVIIPVYNGEKFIKPILKSFMKQKDKDFELIFINDGSKDDSINILNSVKDSSPLKITVIDQKNAGVSAARNAGIKNAKGEFICFCDVDDDVTECYISGMFDVMKNNDVDLVFCKFNTVQSNGNTVSDSTGTGNVIIKNSVDCLKDYLYGRVVPGCWSLMAKKELLTKNDLWFAEGYKLGEDIHMIWRIIACSRNVAYLDKPLYFYHLQENSATSKFNDERLRVYDLMKDLEDFMDKKAPQFAQEYKKYCAAKVMWSLTWQASVHYNLKQYKEFIKKYNVKNDMKNLVTFNNPKVALSSIMFRLSPSVFRQLAIQFGKKFTH
jgi:glycosyltransferase involved in cell wall biosynthesis